MPTPRRFLHVRPVAAVFALALIVVANAAPAEKAAKKGTATETRAATAPVPPEFWHGLERHEIQLKQKLLVVKGSRGIVACPYLRIETFARGGEACAIVAAATIDGMPASKVSAVTPKAEELGIHVGMSGREALERIR